MMKHSSDLGSWAPQKKKRREPNELRDTNPTLWTVVIGGVALAVVLVLSFFAVSRLFPSLFFFGTKETAAVMDHRELTMSDFRYYFVQAAQEDGAPDPAKGEKKLKERALELAQRDRMYPILFRKYGLELSEEEQAVLDQRLAAWETGRDTPLFRFQMQSRAIGEELWRELIVADSDKVALKAYFEEHADPDEVQQKAEQLFREEYVKLGWIRFCLTDPSGNPLPEQTADALKTESYQVYQKAQSGEQFAKLQRVAAQGEHRNAYDQLVRRGQLSEELDRAAFSLEVGEVSEPIETDGSICLICRMDASDDFAAQQTALLYEAKEALFDEWIASHADDYPIRAYRRNISRMDGAAFLRTYAAQKEEADRQIAWIRESS